MSTRQSLTWHLSPDLLGTVNSEGYFETANPAWLTVLGWTEAEATAVSFFELLHPDDVEPARKQFTLTQQGQPAIKFANRYRCKDGSYRWISWIGVPEDGMIFCSGRDITVEVEQAEALAVARRERDTAWAVSQDLLVTVARDGTFRSVNTAWTKRLGWTEGELLGRLFTELTHPDDLEAAQAVFANVSQAPLSAPFEHRLRHKDGSYRWFAWTAALAGELIYGNGRDTTAERENAAAQRAAENALRDSLAFLVGTGNVARAMRETDWSASPLGHPGQWPQSLRSVVNLVLGSALPMLVAWGPQLIAIYNDPYAVLCGAKHPAALGQPMLESWPEVRSVLEGLVARALAGESFFIENLPLRLRRNGVDEDTWFTFSYAPLMQEDGQIAGLYCACIETTQAMLAQQTLIAREQWLQSLFDQAPGFAAVLRGPDHRFVMVNQAYSDLSGNRSLVGMKMALAFPEAMEQGFGVLLDEVYASGQPYVGRAVPVTASQGEGIPARGLIVDFMYQPLHDAQGRIEGIFIQGHNITEQHHAQQALQAFSDSIPAMAWVATSDGLVERFNAQWYSYTGTSDEQAVGRVWVKWVHPDDVAAARAAWEGARGGKEAWQVEYRLRRKDGVYRWFLVRAVPQLTPLGAVARWFGTTIDVHDAREAEEQRRLLASIVENSSDFIGIADTHGQPLYGNRAAMELVGLKDLEQVRGSKILDYFIPEQRQFVDEVVLPAVAKGGRWSGELTMQHFVTGATFPVWYDLFRVDDPAKGQPVNFATITRDLSASKRAEASLRASEARLRRVFESNVVGMIRWDLDRSLILDANAEFLRMTGHVRDDITSGRLSFRDLTPPEWTARNEEAVRAIRANGYAPPYEKEYFHKDGSRLPLIIAGTRFEDSPSEGMSFLIDLTEMKRAEAMLRDRTELLNGVLEGTTDVIFVKDLNGRLLLANAAFAAAAGSTPEELVGKTDEEWFPPDVAAAVRQQDEAVIAGGSPMQFEDTIPVAGEARVFLTLKAPLSDGNNRVVGILGIGRDITERKRIELNLIETTAFAVKANRAKSDFLSNMSHELRTPLHAILGFAQLLESGAPAPTPVQKRNLEEIVKGGWYLLDLVNELLDLAHIESGKLSLAHEPVSLAELMLECRALIEPLASERAIALTFPSSELASFVLADRTRLKQVVINLLSNAVKYNKTSGAVNVEFALSPPDAIRVSLRDTGEGLAPEQLAQLFQPFNRLGREAGPEQGTGIGLVMSRRLVELMGGAIGAESVLSVGSVFWFELKRASAEQVASQYTGLPPAPR